jgi:outer membrane protein assembly factor BamB
VLWRVALVAAGFALCCTGSAVAEVTGAADNLRTGWYPDEPSLAPGSVTPSAFGQAFQTPLKGVIMAQPLVANGTLLVVTEDDMAYGLDPVSGAVRWEKKFGTPVNASELGCPDISPHVGITSTPVIDTASNVAYFVANASEPVYKDKSLWYMHAVNLANGEEVPGFPVKLSENKPDNGIIGVTLEGNHFLQRPALLMMEGVVYAAFGSHCDFPPYAGVILGVSTSGLFKTMWAVGNKGGSIWQAGGGLVSDGPKQILFTTANPSNTTGEGDPPPGPGNKPPEGFLAESVVRLQVQAEGHLKATDFFSPFNNKELDKEDFDLGSAAPIALPSQYFGTPTDPNLIVQAGKKGEVYLLNRSELGGMGQAGGKDNVIEEKGLGEYGGVWDGFAVWPGDGGYVYIPGVSKPATGQENFDYLRYFKYGVTSGKPNLSIAATSTEQFGFGSGSPIVTSNGTGSGSAVLWITRCANVEIGHCENAELWAYDATPVEGKPRRLWTAPIGFASKFSRPDASGGHIYVGNHEGDIFAFSPRALTPSNTSLEFGTIPVGDQHGAEVTFTNTGTPLKVSAVRPPSAPFEATGLPAVGTVIAPGQVISVRVAFSPGAPGGFSGSLGFTTEAGESTVALSGSAPAPAPPPGSTGVALLTTSGAPGTGIEPLIVLEHLKLRFLASKSSRHRRKATVTYTLSTAGKVQIFVYRRAVSHHCPRGAHSCVRYLHTPIKLTVTGHAGVNHITLDLTQLRPGAYRLSATPLARPGVATIRRSVSFTVR